MISKNFFESLESIAFDRGLEIHDVLDKVEIAIAVACRDTEYKGEIKMEHFLEKFIGKLSLNFTSHALHIHYTFYK